MARVCPVRMSIRASGVYPTEAPSGPRPHGASPFFASCLPDPSAQQPPDLGYHTADVFVLTIAQPAPAMRQTQVKPQPVERNIRADQGVLTTPAAPALRLEQMVLQIEGRVHQPLTHGVTVRAREPLALG